MCTPAPCFSLQLKVAWWVFHWAYKGQLCSYKDSISNQPESVWYYTENRNPMNISIANVIATTTFIKVSSVCFSNWSIHPIRSFAFKALLNVMNNFNGSLVVCSCVTISHDFFAGIVRTYISLQLTLWWLFHTSALLWKVAFPFHARSFDNTGKTKYIHITCVLIGVVIPLIPVVAVMADFAQEVQFHADSQGAAFVSGGLGFKIAQFTPIVCLGYSSSVFYTILLPIILIFFIGIPQLMILFILVHRVSSMIWSIMWGKLYIARP